MTFPLKVSLFKSLEDTQPQPKELSLDEAREFFAPESPPTFTKEERDAKAARFSFTIYKPETTRKKDNVQFMTGFVFDFDTDKGDVVLIETMIAILEDRRINYLWYTTWSHTEELHRWRLIIPFLEPLPVSQWKTAYDKMMLLLDNPLGIDQFASRDVARLWCVPCQNPNHQFDKGGNLDRSFLDASQIEAWFRPDQTEAWAKHCQAVKPVSTVSPLYEPQDLSQSDVRDMLDRIRPDCDYETWIRIGMALHHHFGGTTTGLDLWEDWSRGDTLKFKGRQDLL